MYNIYKITNLINNKIYIGYTDNFEERLKEHKVATKHYDFALYKAIRKYGWNNFNCEIIYQSWDKLFCKNEMEKHFINEYQSHITNKKGYNMTFGGEGNTGPKTKEHSIKIGLANKGKKRNEEFSKNLSDKKSKKWLITNKNGKSFEVKNLYQFCKDNKLSAGAMCGVSKGKTTHHKGWIKVVQIL
jgi:group I intron endonuclease